MASYETRQRWVMSLVTVVATMLVLVWMIWRLNQVFSERSTAQAASVPTSPTTSFLDKARQQFQSGADELRTQMNNWKRQWEFQQSFAAYIKTKNSPQDSPQ